jgi:DNA-binding transcriptional regulator YhcF (GntR family)
MMTVKARPVLDGYEGDRSREPKYRQIELHFRQAIAAGKLQSGDRLPTVRGLALSLGISTGTVTRAYEELKQDGAIQSRRGGGTTVAATASDPRLLTLRQRYLSDMVGNTVLKALSLSYGHEEIQAAFSVHLDQWREERKGKA